MKFCNRDISKTKTARSFKLALLIADNEYGEKKKQKKKHFIFFELLPFANLDIENMISQNNRRFYCDVLPVL